jgi:DNA polymerase III subunit epsilon
MNRFTAIDFETANKYQLSACALGIVVFEDGMEIMRKSFLIKPPSPYDYFDPTNVRIHQITSSMVSLAPSFYDIFPIIEPYLRDSIIIAHNADFDLGILRALIAHFHCELPPMYYGCTVQLSRKAFEGLTNYKLNTVAEALGFPLNHHDALSDALACANIMLTTMMGMNEFNVLNCFNDLGVNIKQII